LNKKTISFFTSTISQKYT